MQFFIQHVARFVLTSSLYATLLSKHDKLLFVGINLSCYYFLNMYICVLSVDNNSKTDFQI